MMLHLTHTPTGARCLLDVVLTYRGGYTAQVHPERVPLWADADAIDRFLALEAVYGGGGTLHAGDVRMVLLPGLADIHRAIADADDAGAHTTRDRAHHAANRLAS